MLVPLCGVTPAGYVVKLLCHFFQFSALVPAIIALVHPGAGAFGGKVAPSKPSVIYVCAFAGLLTHRTARIKAATRCHENLPALNIL